MSAFVCEWCLEQGPAAAVETLERQAEQLEHRAAALRELAEAEWELPTIEQLRDKELVADALFEAEYTGWDVNHTAPPLAENEDGIPF